MPPTIDVETAGRAFGLGRTTSYQLARDGRFPCKIIEAGHSRRVITADLLRKLEIDPNGDRVGAGTPTLLAEHAPTNR